jgi:hypothetical protein
LEEDPAVVFLKFAYVNGHVRSRRRLDGTLMSRHEIVNASRRERRGR